MGKKKKWALVPNPRYFSVDGGCSACVPPGSVAGKTAWETAYALLTGRGSGFKKCGMQEWSASFGEVPEDFSPPGGYALSVSKEGISIGSDAGEGERNAVHTLSQLIVQSEGGKLPCVRVIDWPAFRTRCAHICYHLALDGMPESVPSFNALVDTVKNLANFKYNAVLLEIESMFPYRTNPRISSSDAFCRKEVEELRDLCAELGIEIIPLLQCLGHAYNVLRLPEFADLRETPDTTQQYCPSNEDARKLYIGLAEELISAFSPRRFHIGGDESWMLGVCPACREKAGREGFGALYGEHVGATAREISSRGPAPLVWSDMIEKHPDALPFLPPEAEIVYWKYRLPAGNTGVDFRRFGERKIWAAAGVRFGTCNHTMYRCHESMQGISFLAGEARREGCSNWIATDWMKAVPYELSAFGQAYAAEEGWHGGRAVKSFSGDYTEIAFGSREENWHAAFESLEHPLPYCEDAQTRQPDKIDRYDLSGLTFRERIARYTSTVARFATMGNRLCAREDLKKGLEGACRAMAIMNGLEKRGIKRNGHEFKVLQLSARTNSHKARLGAAIDEAAMLLKCPSPGDAKKRGELSSEFEALISEHERLLSESEKIFSGKIPASHLQPLLEVKFEPAALKWMHYFKDALSAGGYFPSPLNASVEE